MGSNVDPVFFVNELEEGWESMWVGVEIACNDVGSWPCSVVGILVDSRHVLKLTRSLVSVGLLSARLGMQVVHRPLAVVHCQ